MKLSLLQKILKTAVPQLGVRLIAGRELFGRQDSYLERTGWLESLRQGRPCGPDGSPLPWMNYAVSKFLADRLHRELDLFEWGSGFSTLFFAARVRSVTSVEYDRDWHMRISAQAPANVNVLFREKDIDGEYCRAITLNERRYDVVLVDGRDRVNCVRQGLKCLTDSGVLLLDDAERDRYADALEIARAQGFRAMPFEALKPLDGRLGRTVLFYRPGNCLGV